MKAALAIVWGQWRAIARNPLNLVFIVALPLAMAVVFAGIYRANEGGEYRIGIVTESSGPVTERLVDEFEESPATALRFDERDDAERAVRRRSIDAVVVIPSSVDDPSAHPVDLTVIGPPGIAEPGGLRTSVQLATTRVAALVATATELAPEDPLGAGLDRAEVLASDAGVVTVDVDDSDRALHANTRALFGMLVLFTFINVMAGGADLASMREHGLLSRLRATPASDATIVAGFAGWLALYGIVQAGTVAIGGTILLGLEWHAPVALALTVVLIGCAAGTLSALLSTFLPPYPVGTSIAGGIAFVLGLLGGCLWSLDLVSPTMRTIGHLTPQAWAIDALMSTMWGGGDPGIEVSLVTLVGFTLVCAFLATILIRRRVASTA